MSFTDIRDELARVRSRASLLELALVHAPGMAEQERYRDGITQLSTDLVEQMDALGKAMEVLTKERRARA